MLAKAPEDACTFHCHRHVDRPRQLRFAAGLLGLITLFCIGDGPAAYYRTVPGLSGNPSTRLAPRWPTQLYGGGAKSRIERRPKKWFRNANEGANRAGRRSAKLQPQPQPGPLAYQAQPVQPLNMPVPPVSLEHEEFVLFYRTKGIGEPWRPMSVVMGGNEADYLVKNALIAENPVVYRDEIVRSLGELVYQNEPKLEAVHKKVVLRDPMFEYAFKIRDKTVPEAWAQPTGLTVIPSKELVQLIPKREIFPKTAAGDATDGAACSPAPNPPSQ